MIKSLLLPSLAALSILTGCAGALVPPQNSLPPLPALQETLPPAEADPVQAANPLQPPEAQKVTIQWNFVAVNEVDTLAPDAARLYYAPELYDEKALDTDGVRDYYGWELAPAYIPEGLTGGGKGPGGIIVRERESGKVVEDQAGRDFWADFWEDGSPKSDDDLYIPRGFTVRCSKLGILHCALLPTDDVRVTDFDTVPVTLSHCSMKHGPFDPTRKAPDGLSNMPAGYYDIYVAAFELDGVEYEVEAQRLELEEVIKIVASIVRPYEDIIVGVGCGMP